MQSKKLSFIEAVTNTFAGFIVSYITLLILNKYFDMGLGYIESVEIVLIFTFISIIRNYLIRRLFNMLNSAKSTNNKKGLICL